jgi:hypothetical protein
LFLPPEGRNLTVQDLDRPPLARNRDSTSASTNRTSHPAPAPAPAPASASAPAAPAPAAAAAPAQWTGTQLAAALLPISDFPAGYSVSESINSGNSLSSLQSGISPAKAGCSSGMMPQIVAQNRYFYPELVVSGVAISAANQSRPGDVLTVVIPAGGMQDRKACS